MNSNSSFKNGFLIFIALGAVLYVPVFGYLGVLPIRIWDESRLAVNAYEMLKNGDFIVTHYDGKPDMWNTKPPLQIWLQVILMKFIGVNELAVRLPSAIAAFFTAILLVVFSLKYLKSYWFGLVAILVLVTSQGYINHHASRTGDYDALLTFFTTASGLLFFLYCETKKQIHLYWFFLATALAILTKGVHGLLFVPALFIYCLIQKEFIALLKNKNFYFGLFILLLIVGGYYLWREIRNPGFLAAVQKNELGGRYLEVIEDHQHGFWYFYENLIGYHLSAWVLFIPAGLITGILSKDKKIKRLTLFALIMVITYFFVISNSQTKLPWYDVPLYPFIAILVAVFIHFVFQYLRDIEWLNKNLPFNVIPFLFLVLIFYNPYQKIIKKTYKPQDHGEILEFYEIGYYLRDAVRGKHDLDGRYLLYEGYYAHNLFYIYKLNEIGVDISMKNWTELDQNDVVFTQQDAVKQYVEDNYFYELVEIFGDIKTYRIYGRR